MVWLIHPKKRQKCRGFSLAEVVLAIAIFAITSGAFVSLALSSYLSMQKANQQLEVARLTREAEEAVNFIARNNWADLLYTDTALQWTNNTWSLAGEGASERIGNYTRTLTFVPVCRDTVNGPIVACPAPIIDNNIKQVVIHLDWTDDFGNTPNHSAVTYVLKQD